LVLIFFTFPDKRYIVIPACPVTTYGVNYSSAGPPRQANPAPILSPASRALNNKQWSTSNKIGAGPTNPRLKALL